MRERQERIIERGLRSDLKWKQRNGANRSINMYSLSLCDFDDQNEPSVGVRAQPKMLGFSIIHKSLGCFIYI